MFMIMQLENIFLFLSHDITTKLHNFYSCIFIFEKEFVMIKSFQTFYHELDQETIQDILVFMFCNN